MRHARRTTLTTSDIDQALRVLNIEPLYGHFPHNPPTFRRAHYPQLPAAGPVFFVEDEEIDFERVLREDKITLPKAVNWTAHWLAVEGVQPLIPENPPAIPKESDLEPSFSKASASPAKPNSSNGSIFPPTPPGSDRPSPVQSAKKQSQQQQQLVKQVLSRELQLYYNRLTTALLSNSNNPKDDSSAKRVAALASLRNDAGLQALLPYLVRWVAEGVVGTLKGGVQGENDGRTLGTLLDVICAILDNTTLFVEPYVSFISCSLLEMADLFGFSAASPTSPSDSFDSLAFDTPSISCDTFTNYVCRNAFSPVDSTFDDIPLSFSSDHENTPARFNLTWEE